MTAPSNDDRERATNFIRQHQFQMPHIEPDGGMRDDLAALIAEVREAAEQRSATTTNDLAVATNAFVLVFLRCDERGARLGVEELDRLIRQYQAAAHQRGWNEALEAAAAAPALLDAAGRGLRDHLFAIVYSNYSPEEVHSIWWTREDAEAKCAAINARPDSTGMWRVIEWAIERGAHVAGAMIPPVPGKDREWA